MGFSRAMHIKVDLRATLQCTWFTPKWRRFRYTVYIKITSYNRDFLMIKTIFYIQSHCTEEIMTYPRIADRKLSILLLESLFFTFSLCSGFIKCSSNSSLFNAFCIKRYYSIKQFDIYFKLSNNKKYVFRFQVYLTLNIQIAQ